MGKNYPCKDCNERQIEPINCHSYCEKYLSVKNENNIGYLNKSYSSKIFITGKRPKQYKSTVLKNHKK